MSEKLIHDKRLNNLRKDGNPIHGHRCKNLTTGSYRSWRNMRGRCLNKNASDYSRYGGAGVTICKRWDIFENFYKDMGDRPEGASLDRKDNKKGYSKSNCRWATKAEQQQNKTNCHYITYKGQTKTLKTWSEEIGLSRPCIKRRLYVMKWSVEKTFETPSQRSK